MKLLQSILLSCLLLAGTVLLTVCAGFVARAGRTLEMLEATPAFVSLELDRHAGLARAEAAPRLDRIIEELRLTRIGALQQVREGRQDAVAVAETYRRTLDKHLGSVNGTLEKETGELNMTLRNLAAPGAATLMTVNRAAGRIDDALPLYLDCDHNPDCAFNRFQGTTKALERSAQTIAAAMPQLTASSIQIADNASAVTGDVRKITTEITKPEKWYFRVLKLVAPVGWAVRAVK